jgi:hypothetical protein
MIDLMDYKNGSCQHPITEYCDTQIINGERVFIDPYRPFPGKIEYSLIKRNCSRTGDKQDHHYGKNPFRFCSQHSEDILKYLTPVYQCECCGKYTSFQKDFDMEQVKKVHYDPSKLNYRHSISFKRCNECIDMNQCLICLKWGKTIHCRNKLCLAIYNYTTLCGIIYNTETNHSLLRMIRYLKGGINRHIQDKKRKGRYKKMTKEIKTKTGGDIREIMIDAMQKTLSGKIPVTRANAVGRLAEQIIKSMAVDIAHHKYVEDITKGDQKAQLTYNNTDIIEAEITEI